MKGFSIIEIIISIAIIGVLTGIVANSFQTAQLKKQQQGIVQSIVSYLEKQKSYTQSGKDGENYGVKFNSSDFIMFTGDSFSENTESNTIVSIDPQFQISETISNNQNIIYFSKLNGNANENATITISHLNNRINSQNLVIENSGTISVID